MISTSWILLSCLFCVFYSLGKSQTENIPPIPSSTEAISFLSAAESGDYMMLREKLVSGTNVNIQDERGMTGLIASILARQPEVFNLLLSEGADVNLGDNEGWNPLMFSTYQGYEDFVEELLRRGANPLIKNKANMSPYMIAINQNHPSITNRLGNVLMFRAIEESNYDNALYLIRNGASPNIQNEIGFTILLQSIVNDAPFEVIDRLLQSGCDVNLAEHDGWTPLIFATFQGKVAVAQSLLRQGADPLRKNNRGEAAMEVAISQNRHEIIDVLRAYMQN